MSYKKAIAGGAADGLGMAYPAPVVTDGVDDRRAPPAPGVLVPTGSDPGGGGCGTVQGRPAGA
jgi:hypothetical protein